MNSNRAIGFSVALLLALLGSGPLRAADVGSVRGVVHDQQHRPLSQVRVKLASATSDWAQNAVTDVQGEFSFMTVPVGDYSLSFSADEYASAGQAVTVTSGSVPVAPRKSPCSIRPPPPRS
jgi:Carboxypeptidase regulatory-like domain